MSAFSSEDWNTLCWEASLINQAEKVKIAARPQSVLSDPLLPAWLWD